VSISPIFYEQLFCTKVFAQLLCAYKLGFVNFWQKDFGTKVAHKMLMKLTPVSHVCIKQLLLLPGPTTRCQPTGGQGGDD
jgi:hypothetical protein